MITRACERVRTYTYVRVIVSCVRERPCTRHVFVDAFLFPRLCSSLAEAFNLTMRSQQCVFAAFTPDVAVPSYIMYLMIALVYPYAPGMPGAYGSDYSYGMSM